LNSILKFEAPPTIASFMRSKAFVRCILGPVGSGKSTGCLIELIRRMCEQEKGPDGIRRTRFAIIRQTLSQIKQTVLKEFYTWAGPITTFKVSENTIYIKFNDVESEIHLIPLDDEQDIRRLLSLQLTGAWINEAPEVDVSIVPALCGRLGRYPSKAQGGPTWFGLIMDGNFGTEGGDWHRVLEMELPADWQFWKQPSGLSAEAENLDNLPGGHEYYERLERSHSEAWVKRYVKAEWGDDPSGTAVFRDTFKRSFHVHVELEPVHAYPLIVGQDFGRDPCSVICQPDHKGRLLVLEEVIAEDIGLELHIEQALRPALTHQRYLGKSVAVVGDPAGVAKGNIYEDTCFDALKRSGFVAFPAPTNDIDPRIRSIEYFLMGQRDGGPALIIDESRCPTIVRALAGGYRYAKTKAGVRKPSPDKNKYSHIIDALQYACLAAQGGMSGMIASRLQQRRIVTKERKQVNAAGWT
jgi:hypothetical protein